MHVDFKVIAQKAVQITLTEIIIVQWRFPFDQVLQRKVLYIKIKKYNFAYYQLWNNFMIKNTKLQVFTNIVRQ